MVAVSAEAIARVAEGDAVIHALQCAVGHGLPRHRAVFALELTRAVALTHLRVTETVPTAVVGARGYGAVRTSEVVCAMANGIATNTVPTAGVDAYLILAFLADPSLFAQALANLTVAEAV